MEHYQADIPSMCDGFYECAYVVISEKDNLCSKCTAESHFIWWGKYIGIISLTMYSFFNLNGLKCLIFGSHFNVLYLGKNVESYILSI